MERKTAQEQYEEAKQASGGSPLMESFREYSATRCAEINLDGVGWDCPDDSLDAQHTPEAFDAALARRRARIAAQ